ncbi:MAG TPA: pentapeptide repeat-containing protein [Streptosporangiaceae bacterium]|nr:pentapeptide repeat-containing protein [Streptosporangiaceae bacterium]
MITLEQWKKNFLDKDTCPWRGPKPMEPGDDDLLVGRQDDRDRFAHEVLTHQLVILHGESGVGKSSLLNVGLVGDLTERGFQPIVCRNWTREAGSPDRPEDFVAAKVAAELRSLGVDLDAAAPQSMVEQLNASYGELAVLVLDQFEELIRHQRPFFTRAMDWIVELNSRYDIHVVISLRSEYVHRLKALNAQIRPFSMSTFELEALTAAEHIRDIMASGNPGHFGSTASLRTEDAIPDPAGLAITLEAIDLLLGEWNSIQETEFRSADVGLLHLQGALYALHARAKPGGNAIRAEHVRQMIAAAVHRHRDIFTLGLIESVARKLDLCEEACLDEDPASSLDEYLIAGTREAVRRTAAHLSSGGFKLDREAWDLAQLALGRELRILSEIEPSAAQRAFRSIYGLGTSAGPTAAGTADLLSAPRTEVVTEARLRLPIEEVRDSPLAELGMVVSPWEADPEGLSAGPMLGYPAPEVIVEELRRFAFALEWLTTSSLIRPTSPAVDCTMLSLIHDGFGEALEDWADSEQTGPAAALVLLTGAQGDVFDWTLDDPEGCWPQFDGAGQDRTIVNLRWRNCRVTARFRHIVFANCDFRGTRFENCSFEGAVFINCLLDGATFGDCDIVGPVVSASAAAYDQEGMPSFRLTGLDVSTRSALSHYRGEDFSGAVYSVTSGIPVTNKLGGRATLLDWAAQRGGLTMYGGRLSSLMIRSGRFRDGGEVALRHIAGSSLDITEQGPAKIQIFGSSIRGLSISRRIGVEEDPGEIDLTVKGSVLANTWFDEGLTGSARIEGSVVWQLLNVSEHSRYRVTLEDCTRYGAVNIEDTPDAGRKADFGEHGISDRADIVHQARLMAYRREPAMVELDQ